MHLLDKELCRNDRWVLPLVLGMGISIQVSGFENNHVYSPVKLQNIKYMGLLE